MNETVLVVFMTSLRTFPTLSSRTDGREGCLVSSQTSTLKPLRGPCHRVWTLRFMKPFDSAFLTDSGL